MHMNAPHDGQAVLPSASAHSSARFAHALHIVAVQAAHCGISVGQSQQSGQNMLSHFPHSWERGRSSRSMAAQRTGTYISPLACRSALVGATQSLQ